ncbi:MAG: VOC family protein, partial [Actinomycetota bacterium]
GALKEFYGDLFGWEFQSPPGYGDYHMVAADQAGLGGAVGKGHEAMPNYVTIYIEVPDITARLVEIEAAGGKTVMERTEVGDMVTIGMFVDPAGNVIGLVESAGE